MKQFWTLLIKEMREAARSYKLVWMPLVFLSLGISDPLVNYYMQDILDAVGNMPEGMEMTMPELAPSDLLMASTGQFQLIGLVVIVATLASAISRERQNGTAVFLYARPLHYSAYFFSKFVAAALVVTLCVVLGYAGSIYYTAILYDSISVSAALFMIGSYMIWMLFVIAFVLCMSALFKTAVAMFISIFVIVIGGLIDQIIGSFWTLSPYKLSNYAVDFVALGEANEHYMYTIMITVLLMGVCIAIGIIASKKNRKKLVL